MIVSLFSVTRKGTQSFATPQIQMINLSRLANPARVDDYTTSLLFYGNQNITPGQGLQVKADVETIQASIAGPVNPNATVTRTPNYINGELNSDPKSIRTGDILYGIQNGGDVLLFIVNPNAVQNPLQYLFSSTTLFAEMVFWNNVSDNIDFTGTFGACTSSTQAFTYTVNQSVTLYLQKQTDEAWLNINTNTVSVTAGTAAISFNFSNGDLTLNELMRVVAVKADGTIIPIVSKQYTCNGGSASGSGTPTDCGEYSYFDGNGWENQYKELNVGDTCTTGYNVQVSTDPGFPGGDKTIYDIETTSTLIQLSDITAGTYYARTRNLGGVTDWSAVLTFVVS